MESGAVVDHRQRAMEGVRVSSQDILAAPRSMAAAGVERGRAAAIPRTWWWAYAGVLAACFLLFQQEDLYHTSASSYAYLNGHFADFYDYNKPRVTRNDYLPLIYVIFAVWNLPLKALGLMSAIAPGVAAAKTYLVLTPLEIVWTKLLLVTGFAAAAVYVRKIAHAIAELDARIDAPDLPATLFAASPVAIFAVFVFGQYDVLGLVFALAGFHALLKGRSFTGALLFSIAGSFKFFAFVAFLPLVLLLEKRLIRLLLLGATVLSATVLQLAAYWDSPAFNDGIFFMVLNKAGPLATGESPFGTVLVYEVLLYLGLCVAAHLYRPRDPLDRARALVLVPIAAYGLMFSAVKWHPQWLAISTPFFALAALFTKRRRLLLAADAAGAIALVWLSVNVFPFNVDSSMLSLGALKVYFPFVSTGLSRLLTAAWMPVFNVVFHLWLFSPLLLVLFERSRADIQPVPVGLRLVAARLGIGLGIFVVPALAAAGTATALSARVAPTATEPSAGITFEVAGAGIPGALSMQPFHAQVREGADK